MPTSHPAGIAVHELADRLCRSRFFRDYVQAFEMTTGLPLAMHPPDAPGLVHAGKARQNAFCMLMAADRGACAECFATQRRAEAKAADRPCTLTCFASLCESSVPVRVGDEVVAFLQVGQVRLRPPSRGGLTRMARCLVRRGAEVNRARAADTYFHTRIITRHQYEAVLHLLTIFAQHLAVESNRLMLTAERPEPPVVEQARSYIAGHIGEEMTLARVAHSVNTSTFYFCKVFRQATGLHFLDYVARVRVERAKNLLLNPHIRISEAAFSAGFQSLSQFNRVFKRIVGEQPRVWRERLAH